MLMVFADWPLGLQTLCRRSDTQLPAIVLLLRQPYLHSGVHLDGSSAQRDAKWARLHGVVAVRCYSAVALRICKQIDMGYAVILQREWGGGETNNSNYPEWSTVLKQCRATAINKVPIPLSRFFFFSAPTSRVPKSHLKCPLVHIQALHRFESTKYRSMWYRTSGLSWDSEGHLRGTDM